MKNWHLTHPQNLPKFSQMLKMGSPVVKVIRASMFIF